MTEKYTGEDAYRLHVQHISGEATEPRVPFLELSDMAIRAYETEADLLNNLRGVAEASADS